ncbi:DUF1501 domain-containing protein [Vibrio astriarenae]|uniref:DUF1501 domain-containing protein n=1 Tax=Vibrio astriarenae TaxID=1481923 RepID=A0A7Z2YFJ9_9VIBR|nr:DUF1501 domain-containing protein [Vibrio astriarenae]QIA65582.1 DUF1501 domain-containing protein [Vibrio astriarenae]
MKLNRRNFLKSSAAIVSSSGVPLCFSLPHTAFAQQISSKKALVGVFLFGGSDSFNALLPMSGSQYDTYRDARPSQGIDSSEMIKLSILADNGVELGLNPAMPQLASLIQQGNAVPIINVGPLLDGEGAPPANMSAHNAQQLTWRKSYDPEGKRNHTYGWAGMMMDLLYDPSKILPESIAQGGSLWTRGFNAPSLGLSNNISGDEILANFPELKAIYENYHSDTAVSPFEQEVDIRRIDGMTKGEYVQSILSQYPVDETIVDNSLGSQLRVVKQMIEAADDLGHERQIFFVSLGGWDSHRGSNTNQLAKLDSALGSFQQALNDSGLGANVTTFTMSEFGRTVRENANNGTDHGWGGVQFVLGQSVNGGRAYGDYPNFSGSNKFQPTLAHEQMAATLAEWIGLSASGMDYVFPALNPNREKPFAKRTLNFMGQGGSSGALLASESSYVRSGSYANDNYHDDVLYLKKAGGDYQRNTLIKFNLPNANHRQSMLRVYFVGVHSTKASDWRDISVSLGQGSWSETSVTWNTQPKVITLGNIKRVYAEQVGSWLDIDISDLLLGIQGEVTLILKINDYSKGQCDTKLSNKELGSDYSPQLVLAY